MDAKLTFSALVICVGVYLLAWTPQEPASSSEHAVVQRPLTIPAGWETPIVSKVASGHNLVQWSITGTPEERYLVQRSEDGKLFTTIGHRTVSVTTDVTVFTYEDSKGGTAHYRLIRINPEGVATYSKAVKI